MEGSGDPYDHQRDAVPRIVFHIGCDKTGTTSLQRWLCRNRTSLARSSVLYPKRNLAFDGLNHTPLVAAYMPANPDDPFLRVPGGDRSAVIASLKREIDRTPQRTVLISAEHFSTRFRGDQIEALRADFAGYDCRIVLVLREHLSRLFSGYATHVAGGGRLTPDAFADEVLLPGNIYLRYEEMIGPWQIVFGDAVTCLAYDESSIGEVLEVAGIRADPETGRGARANVSDNSDVTAALRIVNEALAGDEGAPCGRDWWRTMHVRHAIAARLRKSGCVDAKPPWTLEAARLARLEEIARHDREWLGAAMRLNLPPSSTPVVPGAPTPEASAADLMLARSLASEIGNAWSLERWRGAALVSARPLQDRLRTTLDVLRRGRLPHER